jgi:ribose transport system substrate-binding protein
MKLPLKKIYSAVIILATLILVSACSASSSEPAIGSDEEEEISETAEQDPFALPEDSVSDAVTFDHKLDTYEPKKDSYNFYFTYKIVHPWWDAVALGMEDAQKQFLDRGITITYEYMAPDEVSASDQEKRLREAQMAGFDVIGVDVADEAAISPVLDEMIDAGTKVMTFSSSDASEGCKRIAYVGNTHNYQDGADLTEALCKKLGYEGKLRYW